ncbi:response regulator transcription factor [Sedimentitalea sp. XS_ASV28]|uniref:response regulator transcription factor n=1 Tax=Sedimentitalea sp. XS_ASV28 TaxID=3241296 RepID=UPI0035158018
MRVLIADDHELMRDALVLFLQNAGDIDVKTAGSVDEVCACIQKDDPYDLIILDFNMPGMNGLAGLTRTMNLGGGQRVALISGEATRNIAEQALNAGAAGFIPKSMPAKSMVNAVRFMASGEQYAPVDFMTTSELSTSNPLAEKLSRRELQMLKGLTEGKTNKEIARGLNIQEPTVKLHMKNLYRKIGAANRTRAALIAREAGLF